LFVIVGGLLVVALFGALIAPYFIDWSAYKRDFEREVTSVIGLPVTVGGDASVRLLPMPSVIFKNLQIGENADGTPMATIDEFAVAAELMPFLSGEIRVKNLKLVRPKINIEINREGEIAWATKQELNSDTQSGSLGLNDFSSVKLENVSIEDGSIVVTDRSSGRELSVGELYAGVNAQSLLGPWHMDASGVVDGVQSRFTINTGAYKKSGSIRIKFSGERIDQPYRLLLDGPVSLKEGLLTWDGGFKVSPLRGDALARAKEAGAPLEAVVEGRFEANPKIINIPEYRLEIGEQEDPYVVTGRGGIDIGDEVFFRLQADGRQLDLNGLKKLDAKKTVRLEDRLAALKTIIDTIPLPAANGEISIELPAIVSGGTLIREVSAVMRPVTEGWDLRALRMVMPGNTVLEASGRLGLGESFGFDGQILVASRQPSGFAAWIAGRVDPAVRRLSSFGLSSKITISPNQTTFDELELVLDKAILHGKVQRIASPDTRPGIIAILDGDLVNLDDLRAIFALTQGGVTAKGDGAIGKHDLDLRLKAKELRGAIFDEGLRANNVDAHIRVQNGALSIEKLNMGSFFGASVNSSGRISDLLDKPNGNVKFNIQAKSGRKFARMMRRFIGGNPILDAFASNAGLSTDLNMNIEIDATSSGDGSKGQALVNGIVGGSDIKLRIGFNGRASAIRDMELDINGSFSNPTPYVLVQQTGLDVLPLDAPGPLSINAEIAGIANQGLFTHISASAPGSDISADGLMALTGDNKTNGQFDLTLGSTDIQPYLILSGFSVPGLSMLDATPVSLSSKIDANYSGVKFKKIAGQISGNSFSGDLALTTSAAARPKLSGKIHMGTASLPLIQNLVLGVRPGVGLVDDEKKKNVFTSAFLQGLDGDITISSDQMIMNVGRAGGNAREFSSQLVISNGNFNLNNAAMAWMDGKLNGNLSIHNTDGTGLINGQYQFQDANLRKLFGALGKTPFISGSFSSAGSFDGSGRSKTALLAGLTGSGVFSVKNGKIPGLNPKALSQILLATDVDGFEIETDRVREIVDDTVLDQSFDLGDYSEAFSLVQGKLVLRNVSVKTDDLQLSARAELNLDTMETDASLQITYAAGRETVAGATPEVKLAWVGNFRELSRTLDTQALEGYLSIRAYEREQRRVELLQASILEKQRLRREIVRTNARSNFRVFVAEQERLKAEAELKRLLLLEEALDQKRKEEEELRLKALDEEERQQRLLEAEQAKKRKAAERLKQSRAIEAEKLEAARLAKSKVKAAAEQKTRDLKKKETALAAKKRREEEQAKLKRRAIEAREKLLAERQLEQKKNAQEKKEANDAFKQLLDLAEKQRLEQEQGGPIPLGENEKERLDQGGVVRQDLAPPTAPSAKSKKQNEPIDSGQLDRKRLLRELDALLFD